MPDIVPCTPDTVFCMPDTVDCTSDIVFCTPDISFTCKIRNYAESQEVRLILYSQKGANQRNCMPVSLHHTPDSIECMTDNDNHTLDNVHYPLSETSKCL